MNELELFGKYPADRLKAINAMSLEELLDRKKKMDLLRDDLAKKDKLDPKEREMLDLLCEDLDWEMKAAIRRAEKLANPIKKAA